MNLNSVKIIAIDNAIYTINDVKEDIESALKFFFDPNTYSLEFIELKNYVLQVDKDRGQVNAMKIINIVDEVKEVTQKSGDYVLYIVDVDIYIPGMNFVFALAHPRQKRVVLSLYRLKRDYYGLKMASIDKFKERVFKEVLHEFGHIFGLKHCDNPDCVMSFSNTLVDVDKKLPMFCKECLLKLRDVLNYNLPI